MNLEFIGEGPALVVTAEERHLVVADLHFGIEADLACTGSISGAGAGHGWSGC